MSERIYINLDEARQFVKNNDGYGTTRVYAEFLDGVYKGQIDAVKSENKLDELTSAYRVKLYKVTTHFEDLIHLVRSK